MSEQSRFHGLDQHVLRGQTTPDLHAHQRFAGINEVELLGAADAGLFLRAIREGKGLPRSFVAELASMSKQSVRRLERGGIATSLQTTIDVGSVLGCEVIIRRKAIA